jgi:hypothetical protein
MNWRKIQNYEGYEVSDTGAVRSIDRYVDMPNGRSRFAKGRLLKTRITKHGYVDVRLCKNNKHKTFLMHRLVGEAYLPNPENLPQINHLSGIKQDNSVANLQWVDGSANILHAYKNGLNSNCGSSHVRAVTVIDSATGELFCPLKALSDHLGVNYKCLSEVLNGQRPLPKTWDWSGHSYQKYSC